MSENSQAVAEAPDATSYRFGTFELNGQSGELRKNGTKIRLQEQPFQVLRRLLESAGAVVSREELQSALWPADTFVDFDTSLNTAIKRLRDVLGDSADTPVFIETIPRRGYRFLAPVQAIRNGRSSAAPHATKSSAALGVRFRTGLLAGGLVLAAVVGGLIVGFRSPSPVPRVLDSTQITFDGLSKGDLHVFGGKIYFNEQASSRITLNEVSALGGVPALLDSSFSGMYLSDISRDGSKLLLLVPGNLLKGPLPLKVMDLASGSVQSVDGLEVDNVSWAPGGKIAIVKDQDVLLADADGSHQKKLFTAPGPVFYIRYSPDGTTMRFSIGSKLISQESIWEARADGTGLHQILTEMSEYPEVCCGEWSPDGRYYFFQTVRDGAGRIWALPETHSFWSRKPAPVELTTVPPNFYMGGPTPDGKKLIVSAALPRAELARFDSRSGQFVPFLNGISAGDVEGSPDGKKLIYVRYPEHTLWRSKADGSQAAQITGPSLRVSVPHWSPDGTRIAFSATRPSRPWNIFLISADGGPAEQLTNGSISDLDATWSPDGSTIAYGETRLVDGKQATSIQMVDLRNRHTTKLAGSDGICCPRWSPDGRFLLASHSGFDDLLIYEFATQKWTVVAKEMGMIGYMEWTRGGKEIVFDTLGVQDPAFYRLRLSDLRLETIVKIGDIRRYYGPFGPWTGVAPDGSPLLVRDISNEEIYSLDIQLP